MTTLAIDLRVLLAEKNVARNILANRSAINQENGYVGQQTFTLNPSSNLSLPDLYNISAFILYSKLPVRVSGTVAGNTTPTVFAEQYSMVITSGMSGVNIENLNSTPTEIVVIRFSESANIPINPIQRTRIYFAPLTNIAALPANVTNLNRLIVQNIALGYLINDQVTMPGTGSAVQNKYRICDSDGTPNPTGNNIMLLDNNVTQQNFTGDLYLWVEETI